MGVVLFKDTYISLYEAHKGLTDSYKNNAIANIGSISCTFITFLTYLMPPSKM